jgi:hypothetical protein
VLDLVWFRCPFVRQDQGERLARWWRRHNCTGRHHYPGNHGAANHHCPAYGWFRICSVRTMWWLGLDRPDYLRSGYLQGFQRMYVYKFGSSYIVLTVLQTTRSACLERSQLVFVSSTNDMGDMVSICCSIPLLCICRISIRVLVYHNE